MTDAGAIDTTGFERRRTWAVLRAHAIDALLLGGPFCAIICWAIFDAQNPGTPALPGWVPAFPWHAWEWMLALVVLIWAVGFYRQWCRMYRMRCPECGAMLRRNPHATGSSVEFVCESCEIVWVTGLKQVSVSHSGGGSLGGP